jgi:hypothetical protein
MRLRCQLPLGNQRYLANRSSKWNLHGAIPIWIQNLRTDQPRRDTHSKCNMQIIHQALKILQIFGYPDPR